MPKKKIVEMVNTNSSPLTVSGKDFSPPSDMCIEVLHDSVGSATGLLIDGKFVTGINKISMSLISVRLHRPADVELELYGKGAVDVFQHFSGRMSGILVDFRFEYGGSAIKLKVVLKGCVFSHRGLKGQWMKAILSFEEVHSIGTAQKYNMWAHQIPTPTLGMNHPNTINSFNQSGWPESSPLDLDWISHDWPCAPLNETHLIVWKRVYWNVGEKKFLGHLGCPYSVGLPMELHDQANWLLSSLGALKGYNNLDNLMAFIVPVDGIRMRHDQVLVSQGGLRVLPVVVWPDKQVCSWILDWVGIKCPRGKQLDMVMEMIIRWLGKPNEAANRIDLVETKLRLKVDESIAKGAYIDLLDA